MPRSDYIRFEPRCDPNLIADAVKRIQTALDWADDLHIHIVQAQIGGTSDAYRQRDAWMQAAILIADLAEVDSMTLSTLRCKILGVNQDVIF